MKTADYLRFVTPVLPPSERVLKSKVEDEVELHAVPHNAFPTERTTK